MKLNKAFALLLTFAIFARHAGRFSRRGAHVASPMIEKGPTAVLANATGSTGLNYSLFNCQVGLDPLMSAMTPTRCGTLTTLTI